MRFNPNSVHWAAYPKHFRQDFTLFKRVEDMTEADARYIYMMTTGKVWQPDSLPIADPHDQVMGYQTALYHVSKEKLDHLSPQWFQKPYTRLEIGTCAPAPATVLALIRRGYDLFGLLDSGLTPEDYQIGYWLGSGDGVSSLKSCAASASEGSTYDMAVIYCEKMEEADASGSGWDAYIKFKSYSREKNAPARFRGFLELRVSQEGAWSLHPGDVEGLDAVELDRKFKEAVKHQSK
jgi:hypothetical protein